MKAEFDLKPGDPEKIKQQESEYINYRKSVQPVDQKTWGSVFKNPTGNSAGKLIESCGLKGKGSGDAIISPKHANFIVNQGNASFSDLIQTIEIAKKAVLDEYGIELITEGQIVPDNIEI